MHPKTRAKYGAISAMVLKLVAMGALTSMSGLGGNPMKTNKALAGLGDYGQRQIRKCLVYLRMQGYIRYDISEIYSPFVITKKGLKRHNIVSLRDQLTVIGKKRWDHLWRIVAFDVPESKKSSRDQFREDLMKLGFFPFQKSIYVTPFPCEDKIRLLSRERRIGKYVLVSVTPNLGWRESYALSWFSDGTNL
jgi:DNA-binding transcriptional regulator PaaX